MDIFKNYNFWVLVVSVLYFVAKYFAPNLPFDEGTLLGIVIFILGLFGLKVERTFRANGLLK